MFELLTEQLFFESTETGDITGEKYQGTFEVRKVLTPTQKAQADKIRRDFLGNPSIGESIDTETAELAFAIGQMQVRVIKSPKWYQESNNLKNFVDSNILIELVNKVIEVELNFKKSIRDKAEKAK